MMRLKNFTGKIKNIWGYFLVVAAMALCGAVCPMMFGLNDDVMMRSIIAGTYTGVPDGHAVYMRYPLTGVLSTLYRIADNIPWFTLFYAVCISGCIFVLLKIVCECMNRGICRVLTVALAAEIITGLLFRHYVMMHYTVTAALLGGTGIVVRMCCGQEKGRVRIRTAGSLMLMYLCYMVRSQVFYMALPFLCAALLWDLTDRKGQQRKECLRRNGVYAGVLILGIALLAVLHGIMYGSEEWKKYEKYNEARTFLYDYADILSYEEYPEAYEKAGISREQSVLLEKYGTVLDERMSTDQINSLAQSAVEIRAGQKTWQALFVEKFREYYYRLFHMDDFPNNAVVVLLYLIILMLCLHGRQWLQLVLLVLTGLGRSAIWLYLMMRGRYPERVTVSLYLIETLLLVGICFRTIRNCSDTKGEQACSDRWRKRVICGAVAAAMAVCCPFVYQQMQKGYEEACIQRKSQDDWEEIRQYMAERPDHFFYVDVYSVVSVSGAQYESCIYENYMLLGGWMTRTVLQTEKQKQTGYLSPVEALAKRENVYLVADKDQEMQWFEEYAVFCGYDLQLKRLIQVGRFCVYSAELQ